ncbi:MAG TPA: type IV secretion system DNA-binding domain-containing protein [Candidatus Saccharimonadales bacterium]|nr:type IV secretion system DNA-binding domain-containing protein [Candidatus Saccharimonadales bacterium]
MGLLGRNKAVGPAHEHCLLMLEVPRTNDKKELAAEQMLAALHGILRSKRELRISGTLQEHISLEVAAIGQRIRFYIWTPKHLQAFVEGQIYAQYPTVQIYEQEEDYSDRPMHQGVVHSAELVLSDNETLPIKTFPSFEVDPLAAITATLAKLDKEDEEMWIQIMARPISDDWHRKGAKAVARIRNQQGLFGGGGGELVSYAAQAFAALAKPPAATDGEKGAPELSERDKSRIAAIETKGIKLGYQVKIRLLYAGHDQRTARLRMQALVGAFKQFNSTNLNGFQAKNATFNRDKQLEYQTRFFIDNGYILNIEELASLFHLPHTTVETPNIVWATVKTAEPPSNVPIATAGQEVDISLFGVTNFRGDNTIFGAYRGDRGRHIYILGQTGTGKSGALELLTLSDIYYNQGFAVIDPHGDYAQHVLKFIPERRLDDIVYFNPADREYPIGFNPLEVTDPTMKGHISSELVGVLKKLFAESWGPRLEYILRYTLLALLDYPNSTLLDITRMLTEKKFRQDVIDHLQDPVVRNFWVNEFASWNDKFATEAVAPVLNKVGAFTANPMIRNIVGQPKSTFNIRQIMDEGKILIANLSRGLMGEDNAATLGAMMVAKIQLSAMSRADVPESERRQFYLYVDEFQNFATDSFATILSEARKYALNLTIANQYISQMEQAVRDAVFGNVGTIVSFRVSPDDSPFLQKYFEPQFESTDLIQQHNRYFVVSMTIDGEKAPAFSAKTLNLPQPAKDLTSEIVELSRQRFSQPRAAIEAVIHEAATKIGEPKQIAPPANQQRPKVQAQLNTLQAIDDNKPADHNRIGKVAGSLLKSVASEPNDDQPTKKRRRRRRRSRPASQDGAATTAQHANVQQPAPAQKSEEEHTIRLR